MFSSYSVTLWCGCRVYVSRHPRTGSTNARMLESPDRRQPEPALRFELR